MKISEKYLNKANNEDINIIYIYDIEKVNYSFSEQMHHRYLVYTSCTVEQYKSKAS